MSAPSPKLDRLLAVSLVTSLIILIAQLVPDLVQIWCEWPRPGTQTPARVVLHDGQSDVELKYFIYLPKDYYTQHQWPLLLFLHGSGQRGSRLNLVAMSGPPMKASRGEDLPFILISPQCSANQAWDSRELLALLQRVETRFAVDQHRIYVSGYSMGGNGTWNLVMAAPDRFAAAVPIAGEGTIDSADRLVKLPVWAFHGAHDNVVPLEHSQGMVEAIRTHGGNARLTVFQDQGHGICNLVFSRNDLYEWLLQQRRGQSPQ